MVVPASADFGSGVASGHRTLIWTCHRIFGTREPHRTRRNVAIVVYRRLIFVVEEGRPSCDLACVAGPLQVNMRGTFALGAENRDWVSAGNVSSRPANGGGVNATVNDNELSRDFGSGRLNGVCLSLCVSFYPSCPSSP